MRLVIEITGFFAVWLLCIAVGFAVPQLFDRDVGGALASALLALAGAVLGPVVAFAGIIALRGRGPHRAKRPPRRGPRG